MTTIVTRAGKGSALTWTEGDANITNLNNDKLENVVQDTTPQLGGSLDVNGNKIIGGSYGGNSLELPLGFGPIITSGYEDAITLQSSANNTTFKQWKFKNDGTTQFPAFTFPATDGTANYVLKTNGSGTLSWTAQSSGGISDVVADTTPQLGGNLDVNGNAITSASNGNIRIEPNGSGNIALTPSTGKIILGALDFPTGMGTNGQVLTTNGSSALSFTTITSGISDVVADTTPQLGGNLDVNGNAITSASNGNIRLEPNGSGNIALTPTTGQIILGSTNYPTATPTSGQVLTAGAGGQLSWSTISSGGISNVVEDTTPQLGGNLDTNGKTITDALGGIKISPGNILDGITLENRLIYLGKTGNTGNVFVRTLDAASLYLGVNDNAGGEGTIIIRAGSNGNIEITPLGTGKSIVKGLNYNEGTIFDLGTTGGTVAPNVTNGNVQKITLNSALTINAFTSPVAGQSLTLIINGGTAYTAITSTMKFAGGIKTLTATAGCIDILSVYYDGTTYYASLGKGFA